MWGKKIRKDEPSYPSADVPLPPNEPLPRTGNTYKADPVVESAKHRMADEMERGHTPYNFSGEIKGGGFGISPVATASAVALVAVLAIGFFAWKFLSGVSGKMDSLGRNMAAISSQLQADREVAEAPRIALVRSELRKTIIALDSAIALGDPAVTSQALKLRDEVKTLLASIEPPVAAPVSGQPGGQASPLNAPDKPADAKVEAVPAPQPVAQLSATPVQAPSVKSDLAGAGAVKVADPALAPSSEAGENVQR